MPEEQHSHHSHRFFRQRYDSVIQETVGAFGRYQIRLLLVTQLAYLGISGSLICTIYDNVLPTTASRLVDSNAFNTTDDFGSNFSTLENRTISTTSTEFYSLVMALELTNTNSYVPTLLTTALMAGGVFGAAFFGYAADRYGRRKSAIMSLIGCSGSNSVLLLSVYTHWTVAASILFVLGFFGSGYMVVNLVLLLENVGKEWRLLCASLNGWPLGLMSMALIGYVTKRWDYYHITLAILCVCSALSYYFVYESPRWLLQHERTKEAADILAGVARINERPPPLTDSVLAEEDDNENETAGGEQMLVAKHENGASSTPRKYTYLDLVRVRPVFWRLAALTYSWLAASVISFGIYFNMSSLAGNRFVNTFLTGLFKGATGVLPYMVSRWLGRKPILLISSVITCMSCWTAVGAFFFQSSREAASSSPILTAFAILGTAAIDPMWKINHLYSAELFPTVVRNMARAVCNIGARTGSLAAPQIAYLSSFYFPLPFVVYGCVATVQLVVCAFLPETKGRALPDRLPSICKGTTTKKVSLENGLTSAA